LRLEVHRSGIKGSWWMILAEYDLVWRRAVHQSFSSYFIMQHVFLELKEPKDDLNRRSIY
jgi:hypothetical protein